MTGRMVRAESLPQRGCRSGCPENRRAPAGRQWGWLSGLDIEFNNRRIQRVLNGPSATPAALAIETAGLTKRFGRITAVEDLNLALPAARIYGLLGPNGSGKTTLIRLLAGLARPTSGVARVLGVEMPSRPNLARIGYMTQADGIYLELSVWENLAFFAALFGVDDGNALRGILDLVDLADRRNTPAYELSGGMRRRLSLACALVHAPEVLFLDEPTVGIDPALRVQFWAYFRRLAAGGTTLLVSSHVMDEADRCDELLLILHGRLLAQGSTASVKAQAGADDLEQAFLRLGAAEPES
jgi:ABC-2 type transport system ATP-binding protein